MQCKNCGTQIADKALICYKCGTATTDAKYQPVQLSRGRRGPSRLIIILIAVLLVMALVYYFRLG
jgi:uncharacterized membrane protein YvbJ